MSSKSLRTKTSTVYWVASFFIISFIFIAPYKQALFNGGSSLFMSPIYFALIWSSVAYLLLLMNQFIYARNKLNNSFPLVILFMIGIPTSFLLSHLVASSYYLSQNSIFIHINYFCLFVLGYYLFQHRKMSSLIQNSILFSGFLVIIFGLMNWFGDASFGGLIKYASGQKVYQDAVMAEYIGVRLTSVFQYANTYAAFLICIILIGIFKITIKPRNIQSFMIAFMLVPAIISFMLTLSRTSLIIIPILIVLFLAFLGFRQQIRFLATLTCSAISSLVILNFITNKGIQLQADFSISLNLLCWTIVILASAANVIGILLLNKASSSKIGDMFGFISKKRYARLYIPIATLLTGAILIISILFTNIASVLLPENIANRIESINMDDASLQDRKIFIVDAFKMFLDHPILGAGGGAWLSLVEQYQSYPYISNQTHNFYLQYLLETGIVGLLLLIGLIVFILYRYIQNFFSEQQDETRFLHFPSFTYIVVILIHSFFDFDLSYVYLGSLLFLSLGGISSLLPIKKFNLSFKVNRIIYTVFGLMIATSIILLLSRSHANTTFNKTIRVIQSGEANIIDSLHVIGETYDSSKNPTHMKTKVSIQSQIFKQTSDKRYLETSIKDMITLINNEPHDRFATETLLDLYKQTGDQEKYSEKLLKAIDNHPWTINFYESVIISNYQLGAEHAQRSGEFTNQYWDTVLSVYKKASERIKDLDKLPSVVNKGRPFEYTNNMLALTGQVQFFRSDYMSAAETFQMISTRSLPYSQDEAIYFNRWALASLILSGNNNVQMYQSFTTDFPEELHRIEQITNNKITPDLLWKVR